ncbi:MAG: putative p-cresol methylhydroxylase subunit [Pseudomonadota bacterium]|jgi:mono/diheme cytochrome c family protein
MALRPATALFIGLILIGPAGHGAAQPQNGPPPPPPPIPYTAGPLETFGYAADRQAKGEELGRQIYTQWCAICHEGGPGMAGTESLQRKYRGEIPALLRQRTDLSPELVATFVRAGVKSMPSFRKTEISDSELEALGRYLSARNKPMPGGRVVK